MNSLYKIMYSPSSFVSTKKGHIRCESHNSNNMSKVDSSRKTTSTTSITRYETVVSKEAVGQGHFRVKNIIKLIT